MFHDIERTAVIGWRRGSKVPIYCSGIPGICIGGIIGFSESVEADGRIYLIEGFNVRLLLRIVDDEQKRCVLRPNVFMRAMAVSLSKALIVLNHRCNNLDG